VKNKISSYSRKFVLLFIAFFFIIPGCIEQEDDIIYGPDNPDPWPADYDVAILDSISPPSTYPTYEVTLYGNGFNTKSMDFNFVWFGSSRAQVLNVWDDSVRVEVPIPKPINYLFSDSVDVMIGLQGSYEWSNVLPFLYIPLAHHYLAMTYPAQHPEEKFTKPRGLAYDDDGNLYLMNARLRSIYRDSPVGGERTVFSFGGKYDGGLRFGPDGYLYAANNGDNLIYRISPDGSSYEEWISLPNPWGIDFSESGDLFVVDNIGSDVYKVGANKTITKVADFGTGLKVAYCKYSNGYIYVNTEQEGYIFRFPADADAVTEPDTITASPAVLIADLIFDQLGNMYFTGGTDQINSLYVLPAGGAAEELVTLGTGLSFITILEDFIYISRLDGPVYRVLILP